MRRKAARLRLTALLPQAGALQPRARHGRSPGAVSLGLALQLIKIGFNIRINPKESYASGPPVLCAPRDSSLPKAVAFGVLRWDLVPSLGPLDFTPTCHPCPKSLALRKIHPSPPRHWDWDPKTTSLQTLPLAEHRDWGHRGAARASALPCEPRGTPMSPPRGTQRHLLPSRCPRPHLGGESLGAAGPWGCRHATLWGRALPSEGLLRASRRWERLHKFCCFLGHFHTDSAK